MNVYSQIRNNMLPLTVFLMLSCLHFYYLYRYGINIPFSDDYYEILKNMNKILDSSTLTESSGHLLYGNGYSKPITLRLISLMHLSVMHEINFIYLVFTGNLFLLFTCFVFMAASVNINKYLIITTACFVFQPQYWEAIYQSTLSNSVFSCLFFSLASIYCITQKKAYYYAASLVFAVLAQISFGNGFLVYPILLMVSIYNKNFRLFAVILAIMFLSTFLYMLGNTVSYTAGEQIESLIKIKLCTLWLLEFLGSSIGYALGSGYDRGTVGQTASLVIGLLLVCFYFFTIKIKYYNKSLILFSFLTFFILTGLLAATLRFNVEVPGASRYQIQSSLCVLTTLIIIVDLYAARMNKYAVIMLTVIFPLMFVLASYKANSPTVSGHKGRLATGLWAWVTYGNSMTLTIWSEKDAAADILRQSINRNMYKIPSKQSLMTEAWKP